MASVQLKHVFKRYPNGFEAVKDFNLDIEDKEFIIRSRKSRRRQGMEAVQVPDLPADHALLHDQYGPLSISYVRSRSWPA